jgi:hypothetical protein
VNRIYAGRMTRKSLMGGPKPRLLGSRSACCHSGQQQQSILLHFPLCEALIQLLLPRRAPALHFLQFRISSEAFSGTARADINTELVRIHLICAELSSLCRFQQFFFEISQHVFRQNAVTHDCVCGVIGAALNDAPRGGVSDSRDAHELCLACRVENFQ